MFLIGGNGEGEQREVGERGEDSRTWPLSCLLSSCGSLVFLALAHESIPEDVFP